MFRYVIILLTLTLISGKIHAQWGVSSTVSASYSGVSQNVRCVYRMQSFRFELGPKINWSKSKLPWSDVPGVSLNVDYVTNYGKVFLLSEFMAGKHTRVTETYLGYGINVNIMRNLKFTSGLGFGPYSEKATPTGFTLNGLTYCANAGFIYRF